MHYRQKGTLDCYQSSLYFQSLAIGDNPLFQFSNAFVEYGKGDGFKSPDTEALRFYTLNHLVSIVKSKFGVHEKLPVWAANLCAVYQAELEGQCNRALFYLLAIIVREARHMHSGTVSPDFWLNGETFGNWFREFVLDITSKGEDEALSLLRNNPPSVDASTFVKAIDYIFCKGKWTSGYGGSKWGKVAKCLLACLDGSSSMETMLDTCFTLAHNNGPIFNKGLFYSSYSHSFVKFLDVQRSGQIPELLMDADLFCKCNSIKKSLFPLDLLPLIDAVQVECGHPFRGYVDWKKVTDLGAKSSFYAEQKMQLANHPVGSECADSVTPESKGSAPTIFTSISKETAKYFTTGLNDSYPIYVRAA
jgi:hypothetical protein